MPSTKRPFQCQQCGGQGMGEVRPNRQPKYCSRACRDEARRTGVTLTCRQCGQGFYRKRYQETWSQERGPFCSMPCYGAWQSEHLVGPESPSWGQETNPSGRGSHRWMRQRAKALARDGHRCVRCGSTEHLHVHHVVPWEPGQADPHALDNLETLCALHHRRVHRALGGS
jgi:hypothetical protein